MMIMLQVLIMYIIDDLESGVITANGRYKKRLNAFYILLPAGFIPFSSSDIRLSSIRQS